MVGKQAAYHSLAEYHQSLLAKENKEFGEEIARLKVGADWILCNLTLALCENAAMTDVYMINVSKTVFKYI